MLGHETNSASSRQSYPFTQTVSKGLRSLISLASGFGKKISSKRETANSMCSYFFAQNLDFLPPCNSGLPIAGRIPAMSRIARSIHQILTLCNNLIPNVHALCACHGKFKNVNIASDQRPFNPPGQLPKTRISRFDTL